MNIQHLIPGGDWKYNGEYVIRCPYCGDAKTHNHLHINVSEKVFHCFHCGEGGYLQKLFRKLGIQAVLDLDSPSLPPETPSELQFKDFFPIVTSHHTCSNLARNYLEKRGITTDEMFAYDMRITTYEDSPWYGRVLIPVMEHSRMVCVVGRSYLEFIKPKYLYPRRGETLLTAGETLYMPRDIESSRFQGVVIVEGVFDALSVARKALDFYPVSILGKHLNWPQRAKILRFHRDSPLLVMLDADALEDSLKLAKDLASYDRKVYLALLKQGDPDTATSEELAQAIEESRSFSFETEQYLRLGKM